MHCNAGRLSALEGKGHLRPSAEMATAKSEMTIDHVVLPLAEPTWVVTALALTSTYVVLIDGLE
jgi:hypothetical protein